MSNTIILRDLLQKEVIRNLERKSLILPWANQEYTGQLKQQGDTVTVQNFPNLDFNLGVTAGNDITTEDFVITAEDLVINQSFNGAWKLPDIDKVRSNLDLAKQIGSKVAYRKSDTYDRFIASLVHDAYASNKLNELTPATLTTSTVITQIGLMKVKLSRQNAFENAALFVNPEVIDLITQSNLYTAYDGGLPFKANGVVGKVSGFTVIETNNLPYKQSLTIDTNPTATNKVVIEGVTFEFVAVPATAGQVDIGATAAISAANFEAAVNGTGTPGVTTYIDISAADRQTLRRAQVNLSDFTSDVAALTANDVITATETFTAGTNVFGTGSRVMFAMDRMAINFVKQLEGGLDIRQAPSGFYDNLIIEDVYGGKVFDENSKRIVTAEITNGAT